MITITAFPWVPPFARGQVRDLRVRWALEEAGLPYETRLLEQGEGDTPDYRALQPFGQVPIFLEDEFVLFESGAIVLHIGERSEVLLPKDAQARARATQWLIAALNSIEPYVMNVALLDLFYADQEWAKLRRPSPEAFLRHRLGSLSKALGDKPYPRRRSIHRGRFDDVGGAAHPALHRHRGERPAPRCLCCALHLTACFPARARRAARGLSAGSVICHDRRSSTSWPGLSRPSTP